MSADALAELLEAMSSLPPVGYWVADAACRGRGDVFTTYPGTREAQEAVEATCGRCPVRGECMAYGDRYEVDGVWAGEWHGRTGRTVQTGPRAPRVVCGTQGGYRRHRRLGEAACEACKAANAAAARAHAAKRAA